MRNWTVLQNWGTTPINHQSTIISSIFTNNKARIDRCCSLQIRNTGSATISTLITSNLWILTLTTELDSEVIMVICPDQALKSIKVAEMYSCSSSTTSLHCNLTTFSIYHLATRITRWCSTYHLTQLSLTPWTFHHWCIEYGNTWRTIGMIPNL